MKRLYVQHGKNIRNPVASYSTAKNKFNSLTEKMCQAQKANFSEFRTPDHDHRSNYNETGRLAGVGLSL